MRYLIEDVLPPFLFVLAVLMLAFGILSGGDYLSCRGFQQGTGIETRWFWSCYAKMDGVWVPKDYVFGSAKELRLKDKPKR